MNEDLLAHEHAILLFDLYSDLLTEKQRNYFSLYYEEDLSFSEISEICQVSRNAAFDQIKRTIRLLEDYESKLHLLEKHQERMKLINQIEETKKENNEDLESYLEMLRRL